MEKQSIHTGMFRHWEVVVFSHKECWPSEASPVGFATDGGFVFHMQAIAGLFRKLTVVVPVVSPKTVGEVPFAGANIVVEPLYIPKATGWKRKLWITLFFLKSLPRFVRLIRRADGVHTPIPSDIGTFGMLLAHLMGKPLFVRHCGNWLKPVTPAERGWKWYMEKYAGGPRAFLATGGGDEPPSRRNPSVEWIFSSSITREELALGRKRDKAGSRPGPVRLVIACRQDHQKGTGRVIEAMRILRDRLDCTLQVVGDGPDKAAFEQQAATAGLAGRVSFSGKLDHMGVLAALRDSDIFVYPTEASEGFPKVVLEALSCGLPVIATPVSVLPGLVGDSGAGVVVPAGDMPALVSAIYALATDKAKLTQCSDMAYRVAAQYSLESWAEAIEAKLARHWKP